MKNTKKFVGAIILFAIIAVSGIFQAAWGADDMVVTDIQPVYVEKGAVNYTITVRVIVENNGEGDDIVVDIAAVDGDGFQLKTLKLNDFIEAGKKKALMGQIKMEKTEYEKIAEWELLN